RALADDERARDAVRAGLELLLARPGHDHGAGRHLAAQLDRLLPADVDDRRRRRDHDIRPEHGLAADPDALDDDAPRADERAVLDDHGAGLERLEHAADADAAAEVHVGAD